MKQFLFIALAAVVSLATISCEDIHQKIAKSKYGDADRIRCTVKAVGGVGHTVDDVLIGMGLPVAPARLASMLNLPGSGALNENLIVCEKQWYWGGARHGNKWVQTSDPVTLIISTPTRVPNSSEIVLYTTRRNYGSAGETRNYNLMGTIGDVEVWRYKDDIRTP